jgi:sRNA-binding regulator protein Hfq
MKHRYSPTNMAYKHEIDTITHYNWASTNPRDYDFSKGFV